ncbi:amidohydrolase family protein [Legionella spiritensis]|uniref:5-carboxyvanillate decarboxylase n=1 Tax=Legionella spiritensis TaxID=452 RepID=A0A0W0YZ32_LEGSP|nr:amidohydrolase family protein [Legionella spiritensis]KTD62119.1 5-carboxyvanillate decarboxylase [Legionella spiritensis]SNV34130.1 5-carboxyvanillate decarboxylase [Legionella spiritensis]
MKKIALEEAMIQPGTIEMVPDHMNHPEFKDNLDGLLEIGEARIADMDANEIAVSVLSVTTPGLQGLVTNESVPEIAGNWNDYLSGAVQQYPDRFKALACVPTITGQMAADEIERVVKQDEFVGCMINGFDNSGDMAPKYLDSKEFDPFWAALEKHRFPLYIHPRGVPDDRETTYSPYDAMKGAAWGFHIETAEHCARMMLSGVFDRFPNLTVIIGHMGEMLPFWAWRMDHRIKLEGWFKDLPCQRLITDYLTSNFYITTSGFFHTPALQHALAVMGIDKILFSVDYPYEDSKQASDWFESIPLNDDDKYKIAYGNAARLLFE